MFSFNNKLTDYSFQSDDFSNIVSLSESEIHFLNTDFQKIDYRELFTFFIFISLEDVYADQFLSWFNDKDTEFEILLNDFLIKNDLTPIKTGASIYNYSKEKQKKLAEELLFLLHKVYLKKYSFNSNNTSEIYKRGYYNCVSSSIFYSIILKKYHFDFHAVETKDHVFISVKLGDEFIDVETTNRYGLNPGEKKEVLSQFGEVTGFSYVPKSNYNKRSDIEIIKLLLMVFHNNANIKYKQHKYIDAIHLGYIIKLGRNDKNGDSDFMLYFKNYISRLFQNKNFLKALYILNDYILYFGDDDKINDLRYDAIAGQLKILSFKDENIINEYDKFLFDEHNRYQKDDEKFEELYIYFVYRAVNYYISVEKYKKAINFLYNFDSSFINEDTHKLCNNILVNLVKSIDNTDQIQNAKEIISYIKKRSWSFTLDFDYFSERIDTQEVLLNLKENNFIIALQKSQELFYKYETNDNVSSVFKEVFIKYAIDFYEKKDYKEAIEISKKALKFFPEDSVVLNNLRSFYFNYIKMFIDSEDNNNAGTILLEAKKFYPNDRNIRQLEDFLRQKN